MTDVFLYSGDASPNNVVLSDPTVKRSGGVNYTLSLASGSYTYSGKSASLPAARNLALAVGSYPYSGKTASLTVARNLALSKGVYSYAGLPAQLTLARNFALGAGAYSYVGNDATLVYVPGASAVNYTLSLAAGAYSYSGKDALLGYATGSVRGGGYYRPLRKHWYEEHQEKQRELQEEVEQILTAISKKALPKKRAAKIKLPDGYSPPDMGRLVEIQKQLELMREIEDEEDMMLLL